MPPVIAVTPCGSLSDYLASIERAGGRAWVLDRAADRVARVASKANGLLLTGGGDVDPARYGEAPHPAIAGVNARRDEYEMDLVSELRAGGMPVLGICRGLQVVNVAFGGTLVQDIPTERPDSLPHFVATSPEAIAHDLAVKRGSRLRTLLEEKLGDGDTCPVNSRHHQAVNALGAGLEVTATAPDGIIEGIEDPRAPFLVAVQWHPENFVRAGGFRMLFEGFVAACAGR